MMSWSSPVTVRQYDEFGRKYVSLTLNIAKSEVHRRCMAEIAKAGDSAITYPEIDRLDAGAMNLSTLEKLFSRAEIRRAAESRRTALGVEEKELAALLELLGDDPDEWRAAQGRTRKR